VITDIDLDTRAARRLDLGDGRVGGHILGPGFEFLYERRFRTAESPFPL
jgi:hypothetical protein